MEIGAGAFCQNDELESITIPESVKRIHGGALEGIATICFQNVILEEGLDYDLVQPYLDEDRNVITKIDANKLYNTVVSKEFISDGSDGLKRGGISGDIRWTIDNDGLLCLSGNGDFAYQTTGMFLDDKNGEEKFFVPVSNGWCKYAEEVKKVKLSLKGIKSLMNVCEDLYKAESIQFDDCDFSNVESATFAFAGCKSLKQINMNNLDMPNLGNAVSMFAWCPNLESINLDGTRMPNVRDLSGFFCGGDEKLKTISWKDSQVTKVKSTRCMFGGCYSLEKLNLAEDLPGFDTSNVSDFSVMFANCFALKDIDIQNLNTSSAVTLDNMFSYCKSLEKIDLSNFDTRNVVSYSCMFYVCDNLKKINLANFNTSKGKDFSWMFAHCYNLEDVNIADFDTTNGVDFSYMFAYCHALKKLDLSPFDLRKATNVEEMLCCQGLEELKTPSKTGDIVPVLLFPLYDRDTGKEYASLPKNAVKSLVLGNRINATGIKLNKTQATIVEGKEITLIAKVTPEIASQNVEWSTSSPEVATVSENGVVKGIKPGQTIITAKTTDGTDIEATCKITVTADKDISKSSVTGIKDKTYTGKAITQLPTIKLNNKKLKLNTDYKISYKKNVNVGTATMTITGKGDYKGSIKKTFKIKKASITISSKTIKLKAADLKKTKHTIKVYKAFNITKNTGKMTFKKKSGNKNITISKSGKVTVKKGLKKGTYKVKVKVTAYGDKNHKKASKTVTLKIVVK